MQFNEFSLYSLNTQIKMNESKNKIFDDIKNMEKLLDYYEVLEFIENNYGKVENHLEQEFSDDIKLSIDVMTDITQVVVSQNEKILFGKRWIFTPDEEPEIESNIKFTPPEIRKN